MVDYKIITYPARNGLVPLGVRFYVAGRNHINKSLGIKIPEGEAITEQTRTHANNRNTRTAFHVGARLELAGVQPNDRHELHQQDRSQNAEIVCRYVHGLIPQGVCNTYARGRRRGEGHR